MHDDFRMHRADEKMILILGADIPRVRQSEEIELVITDALRSGPR